MEVALRAGPISMRGIAPIEVDLVATSDGFLISPFLQVTRGITFEVTTPDGKLVNAAEPMVGSPPPPPLQPNQLVAVAPASPDRVLTKELARTIFPRPGRYKIKAHVFIFDFPIRPGKRVELISNAIDVKVTWQRSSERQSTRHERLIEVGKLNVDRECRIMGHSSRHSSYPVAVGKAETSRQLLPPGMI